MKKLIEFTLVVFIGSFNLTIAQAPPAWGIAPLLTTTTNNTNLTYQTTNYITHAAASTSVTYSGWKLESGGVGVYTTFGGDCFAMTYDPGTVPFGAFKSFNLGSSAYQYTLGVTDGIAYCHNQFEFNAATYDPFRIAWKEIGTWNGQRFVHVEDGMVLFRNDFNNLYLTIYDPTTGFWASEYINESGYNYLQIETNIALFQSDFGYWFALAYDFEDNTWHYEGFGSSLNNLQMEGGVISWTNSARDKIYGAVYDFDAHDWIRFQSPSVGGTISGKSSNEGTIYYQNTAGIQYFGYDYETRSWKNGEFTKAKCNLFEYHPITNPKSVSFVTTYSIGGRVTSITCTDGYGLNRAWGFKPLTIPGYFALGATITNLFSESICEQYVYYNHTVSAGEISLDKLDIYPNPTTVSRGVDISSSKNIVAIKLINFLGVVVAKMYPIGTDVHFELPAGLVAGNYVLDVELPKGERVRKKVLVQ